MIMFGKSVEYFLDELDGNLDKYNQNLRNMFSSCEDYIVVKRLYDDYPNKEEAKTIIENVLEEFDAGRANRTERDWKMTNDHCVEIYDEYPSDFTKQLLMMMYQELYDRDSSIKSTAASQKKTYSEIQKMLLDKGC